MTPTDPSPTDRMLAREDATAERGSLPWRIAGALGTLAVGAAFIAMVALAIWGWLS